MLGFGSWFVFHCNGHSYLDRALSGIETQMRQLIVECDTEEEAKEIAINQLKREKRSPDSLLEIIDRGEWFMPKQFWISIREEK